MIEFARQTALRFLRLPPQPQPPAGAPGSLQTFRAAPGFLRLCLLRWCARQTATLLGLLLGLFFLHAFASGQLHRLPPVQPWMPWIYVLEGLGVVLFLLQLPITLAAVWLDFDLRWYLVTDRSLRIRSGIWRVDELTMTYANVQELTIRQGPLQRLLGIADLVVRSAGGGSANPSHAPSSPTQPESHVAYFHGVDNAETIRDLIVGHLKHSRSSGLGDPDDPTVKPTTALPTPLGFNPGWNEVRTAANLLLSEAQALRQTQRQPASTPPPPAPRP